MQKNAPLYITFYKTDTYKITLIQHKHKKTGAFF
jgi:hypothetical protein